MPPFAVEAADAVDLCRGHGPIRSAVQELAIREHGEAKHGDVEHMKDITEAHLAPSSDNALHRVVERLSEQQVQADFFQGADAKASGLQHRLLLRDEFVEPINILPSKGKPFLDRLVENVLTLPASTAGA
eukprot:scaffold7375_cov268-Pinguiococcus_pyrenoidosus.AAC.12